MRRLAGARRTTGSLWASRRGPCAVMAGLLLALLLARLPIALDFKLFAFYDQGSALRADRLVAGGLVPTVDFGFSYGLLPLALQTGQPGRERIFKAYFSSCCGGSAASAVDAFNESPTPPLSAHSNGSTCSISPKFNWPPVTFSKAELTRRIRTMRGSHQLRIIGVSSSTNRLLSARFLKAGGNDFMLRPFIEEEFYCRVNQNLDTIVQIQLAKEDRKIAV